MSAARTSTLTELIAEAQRVLAICNACRYCEGYCAVFPALERRLAFTEHDVHYLANLCHNCGACLYACQYAPPHEFQLNFPRVLAQVRTQTYRQYAWPAVPRRARSSATDVVVSLAADARLAVLFAVHARGIAMPARFFAAWTRCAGIVLRGVASRGDGGGRSAPYSPSRSLALRGELRALLAGHGRVAWASSSIPVVRPQRPGTRRAALPRRRRRRLHLPRRAPVVRAAQFPPPHVLRLPAVLRRHQRRDDLPLRVRMEGAVSALQPAGDARHAGRRRAARGAGRVAVAQGAARPGARRPGADRAWTWASSCCSSRRASRGLRCSSFARRAPWACILALHLGAVLALFLTMPYGKFVHGLYRFAALVRFHVEHRRPLPDVASE